jgi:aminopeptidase N
MRIVTHSLFRFSAIVFLVLRLWAGAQSAPHQALFVELMPADSSLRVIDTLVFTETADRNRITFSLHKNLQVQSLDSRVRIRPLHQSPATPDGVGMDREKRPAAILNHLQLQTDNPIQAGDTVIIQFSGRIFTPLAQLGDEYARGFQQTPGIIAPEGVYLAGSTYWLPRFGTDLFSFAMTIDLPANWKTVTQGRRIFSRVEGAKRRERWDFPHPAEEAFLIAARFSEYERQAGNVKAMAFLRTADAALAGKYLEVTARYVAMYNKLIGPYPFSKFALVENFWETGYGMPSFTLLGERVIRLPFILHSSYPHELLHNYWGNSVYVDFSRGNWCEGLTAYMADHLIKEQRGQGAEYRRSILQKYTNYISNENDFPVAKFVSRSNPATEAIGYGKTAMVFHMLRRQYGDAVFTRVWQTFNRGYRFQRASFNEIEATYSRVSETDLADYFRTWIDGKGAPQLALKQVDVAADGRMVTMTIRQQQSGAAFPLQLPIAIYTADTVFSRKIDMTKREATLQMELPDPVVQIKVDPEFDVFRRLDPFELPPSLSAAYGADRVLLILPEDAAAHYRAFATSWAERESARHEVLDENDIDALPNDAAVWIIGAKNRWRKSVKEEIAAYDAALSNNGVRLAGDVYNETDESAIITSRHPANPKAVLVYVQSENASAIPGLLRKLPHYGKYSYLVFRGDEPENIAKGQWPAVKSPLHWQASTSSGPGQSTATLPVRQPLAELPPAFSAERMRTSVTYLASEELAGRGLGTPGLDSAANFIAHSFAATGLRPAGDNESYFQSFPFTASDGKQFADLKNIVAELPGSNAAYAGECVVVSAHYDHLGRGWPDAYAGNAGKIHYGADDNASGVAVLLEVARTMAAGSKPERSILFVAFSAEEAGLGGSRYFVKNHKGTIIANLNLDTVGRLGQQKLMVLNAASAGEWKHIFRGVGFVTGIETEVIVQALDASDQVAFLERQIPAVQLFSGPHSDYHRPGDRAEKIDYAGLVKVATVSKEVIEYLASREEAMAFIGSKRSSADKPQPKSGRGVTTGIMPDFTFANAGVKVESVSDNSPAANAGIRSGDVITHFNAEKIADLRSYSDKLKKHQPGDKVTLTVDRRGEIVRVDIILKAR